MTRGSYVTLTPITGIPLAYSTTLAAHGPHSDEEAPERRHLLPSNQCPYISNDVDDATAPLLASVDFAVTLAGTVVHLVAGRGLK